MKLTIHKIVNSQRLTDRRYVWSSRELFDGKNHVDSSKKFIHGKMLTNF